MRTKLFLAFILIIFLALLSNVVFERLIIQDFNNFIEGTREDSIYLVMASIEGRFREDQWDRKSLHEALHWGLMLGFEAYIEDSSGKTLLSSADVISNLKPEMAKRMSSLFELPSGQGEYTWYPLYAHGREIGKLYIRPLIRLGSIPLKEETFRKRGREFLLISFLIAGAGALSLSLLFILYLSTPLRRLTASAEKIAEGDFSIKRLPQKRRLVNFKDEIDRLTETFNYMAEALKREDVLRKHLTSNIAHELRTPLTIIKANLEAIEDGIISDPGAVINNINSEIERIISLVEGIEDITSAEASFFRKGSMETVNLKEFIESVSLGMKKLMEEKGLSLKTEGPDITVKTYPDKLHIVLKNLLTNAYKFTSMGGITVEWDRCSLNGHTGFFITVEDTGRGISEGEIPAIFERFRKGEDSDGRGLGLTIVKELTEVMGGTIETRSTPNKGTLFTVTFPF